ncbi:L-histidine N(alpha)-methyltransferase [Janibacter sp. CX7]|uniref:L-histidine N(alpha)-methyltransferase n=1 Tax=Janibacter sp. CX7 TaxID=2963431 RepID=UPI0020CE2E9B|nr:L-histidine N(alpha)-methyltransferase [Janibacter sp. CX7]UTT66305.1 L-histidine N(alpha)-methyltransferase [Janibacter sp. CX7]
MSRAELEADLRSGLWSQPATLPPRWFYDERGSRLFDEITTLPEYYPTRAEQEILTHRSGEIIALSAARSLHELGAGTATKTRELLDALTAQGRPALYAPLDISKEVLLEAADRLRTDYPALNVEPAVADFHHLPPLSGEPGERLLVFLGGTIGNFEEDERSGFLDMVHAALAPGDHLLLGADLVKDPDRLVAAYDDGAGVTARFNLNLVDVITRTTPVTGLSRDDLVHEAAWDDRASRIEMRLRAVRDITADFTGIGRTWRLAKGEHLRTEISRKFDLGLLRDELTEHGFEPVTSWTDAVDDFSLTLARVAGRDDGTP